MTMTRDVESSELHQAEARPCRFCGALIRVLRDVEGKSHALDASARVFRVMQTEDGALIAVRAMTSFVAHIATCPRAEEAKAQKPKADTPETVAVKAAQAKAVVAAYQRTFINDDDQARYEEAMDAKRELLKEKDLDP